MEQPGSEIFQVLRLVKFVTGDVVTCPLGVYADEKGAKEAVDADRRKVQELGDAVQVVAGTLGLSGVTYAIGSTTIKAGSRIELASSVPQAVIQ